jgi:hypothetical protein
MDEIPDPDLVAVDHALRSLTPPSRAQLAELDLDTALHEVLTAILSRPSPRLGLKRRPVVITARATGRREANAGGAAGQADPGLGWLRRGTAAARKARVIGVAVSSAGISHQMVVG